MSKSVEIREAQLNLAELVAEAATGAEIILMDRATPRARLMPIAEPTTQRVPGLHVDSIVMSDDFDQPLSDEFWNGTS